MSILWKAGGMLNSVEYPGSWAPDRIVSMTDAMEGPSIQV